MISSCLLRMENAACTPHLTLCVNLTPMRCENVGSSLGQRKQDATTPLPKSWTSDSKEQTGPQPSARQLNTHSASPAAATRFSLSEVVFSAVFSPSSAATLLLSAALALPWLSSRCATAAGRWLWCGECVRCASIPLRGLRASHLGNTHATSSCSHAARCTPISARVPLSPHPALGHSIALARQNAGAAGSLLCSASARR
mmetsp:Transcript_47700/g.113530  ORF Transcript_47700/g.113530 Transcript_47700/m.113530 type:complete len:200 (+) Transcript_47700:288-887(+)